MIYHIVKVLLYYLVLNHYIYLFQLFIDSNNLINRHLFEMPTLEKK